MMSCLRFLLIATLLPGALSAGSRSLSRSSRSAACRLRRAESIGYVKLLITAVFAALVALPQSVTAQRVPQEDSRIRLRAMTFDPLEPLPIRQPQMRLAPSETAAYWIIQFQRPLTREDREILTKEYGLRLTEYIPNRAYVERLPAAATRKTLQGLDMVRAMVAFQPAFKVSPDIGRARYRSEERQQMPGLWLTVVLFCSLS